MRNTIFAAGQKFEGQLEPRASAQGDRERFMACDRFSCTAFATSAAATTAFTSR